jgi:hypothetical protein
VSDEVEGCAFAPCHEQAVVTLRLVVDGCEAMVTACQGHTDWVREYVAEDHEVRLVDQDCQGP